LAVFRRPAAALVIDYGQRPAAGERRAAKAVAGKLSLEIHELVIDCADVGGGLLAGRDSPADSPSAEWWPFRNQLLVTLAAAWALTRGYDAIVLGSVKSDGFHVDGTAKFYADLNRLVAMQEGSLRVLAPAINMSTVDLVRRSGVGDEVLVWTTSCHRGPSACGDCPGCRKHEQVLSELGRLQ
jgi:7-cyano-7-deazaguanine synthase